MNGVNYTWDNNGNTSTGSVRRLLNDGVNAYTYNAANQLKTLTGPSVAASYAYNGLGDRLQEIANGQTTSFRMDYNPSTSLRAGSGLTQVLNDGTNNYIYGNERIAQAAGTGTEYFLGDALGSVRQLTDTSGAVTYASAYDPYGVTIQNYGASQSAYGYTGEFTSNEMVYLRARHYVPGMGRFLTRDTWAGDANRPLSFNRWMYGYGNPVKYMDPSGHKPPERCAYYPSKNINFIEKNAGNFLSKNNWLDTYTAAGIAVQCWAIGIPNNGDYDGRGQAQITNAQTYKPWKEEIPDPDDPKDDPRGYGLLCYIVRVSVPQGTVMPCTVCEDEDYMKQNYGVGNYRKEDPHDQTEWRWSVEYMRRTIKLITDECERERNCRATDKFIAAALGQNGPGFNIVNMKKEVLKLDEPTPDYKLDWKAWFQADKSRLRVNTQIQLSRFTEAILALEGRGWFVPNRDKDYINQLIAGDYR